MSGRIIYYRKHVIRHF